MSTTNGQTNGLTSTTSGKTSTMSGETSTASGKMSATSTTSRQEGARVTRLVLQILRATRWVLR